MSFSVKDIPAHGLRGYKCERCNRRTGGADAPKWHGIPEQPDGNGWIYCHHCHEPRKVLPDGWWGTLNHPEDEPQTAR
jgi:hypothetical protein